jgi:hypothetical protein
MSTACRANASTRASRMIEDEPPPPALRDGRSRRRAAILLVLGLYFSGFAWLGSRQLRYQACEQRSETSYHVASYDQRLRLREISGAPKGAQQDQSRWAESRWAQIRPRLDDHRREWMALRTRACKEGHTALTRCLDAQAGKLSVRINRWSRGEPGWATADLDHAIPAPARCLEAQD